MSLLAVHPEKGVYLGHCLGMHFWSKLDPVDQPAAVTFRDANDLGEYNALTRGVLNDCRTLPVEADEGNYASMAACVKAGAPAWEFAPVSAH
jgi:hypothetical protein